MDVVINNKCKIDVDELEKSNTLYRNIVDRYEHLLFIADLAKRSCKVKRYYPKYNDSNCPIDLCDDLLRILPILKQRSEDCNKDKELLQGYEYMKEFIYLTLFSNIYSMNEIYNNNYKFYDCKVTYDEEMNFKKYIGDRKTKILFHGTNISNLFSILRNGVRNVSDTPLMTHGSYAGDKHCPGVYMSASYLFSYNYSYEDVKCMLCFEVDESEKEKIENEYVIDDMKYILRSIIIGNSYQLYKDIMRLLTEKYINQNKVVRNFNKRFNQEIKELNNSSFRIVSEIEDLDKPFNVEFKVKDINIVMEIRLNEDWPYKPPFVRIISPMFKETSNYVMNGGFVCSELLTEQRWSPPIKLTTVIQTISVDLEDDVLEIDSNKEYTYINALKNKSDMLMINNWY